ncbi:MULTISPECIES: hypothetical protein, partial [unclassified Lysinibacillus]|uniref:hypothetical protein n=1 Tax=unclassified Lysinibacillus TaxID=2636778 RepID=UPI00382CD5E2
TKAGIPVTFFIPGSANGVKTPVTVEAVTNDEGIASYTYTRYAATNDTVTVYANGDRSKFSTGYVFWAVDTTLTITEVTEGSTINNGANKVYKVTYKHPDTGKPVSGKVLNVSVKENIDVNVDKLQNVTVNGLAVVQTSDSNTRAAQITTDSKGEATFTVTGSNAEVTPVVFEATPVTTTNANGTVTTTGYTQKYTADTLQASAAKVTFGAIQAAYTLELTRDGGEVAATGHENGRKYKLVVKDKDGKLAANETVNVAFNEDIDGVISTVTSAKFVKVEKGKQVGFENDRKITVKTNSKGEASFIIGTDLGSINTYATPIAWIDINNHTGKDANLDKGEPSAVAPISYFQAAYLEGSKLVSYNGDNETDKFEGNQTATFKVQLTNQSGKVVNASGYKTENVSYTIYNTGAENVVVDGVTIAPNRVHTLVSKSGDIKVTSENNLSTSVKVLATGVAKEISGNKEFAFTAKEATATFTNAGEITNPYTGVLDLASINKKDKEIKFVGKTKAVAYAGESGKTYKYYSMGSTIISSADAFISLLEEYAATGKSVRATYEFKDDVVTFAIVSVTDRVVPPGIVVPPGTAVIPPGTAVVATGNVISINKDTKSFVIQNASTNAAYTYSYSQANVAQYQISGTLVDYTRFETALTDGDEVTANLTFDGKYILNNNDNGKGVIPIKSQAAFDQALANGQTTFTLDIANGLTIKTDKAITINLSGTIAGGLTVNTPNAHINNAATITGGVNIIDVAGNSFINTGSISGDIIITDNNARFVNEGTLNDNIRISGSGKKMLALEGTSDSLAIVDTDVTQLSLTEGSSYKSLLTHSLQTKVNQDNVTLVTKGKEDTVISSTLNENKLTISIKDADLNKDSSKAETFTVAGKYGDDNLQLKFVETGDNTGEFQSTVDIVKKGDVRFTFIDTTPKDGIVKLREFHHSVDASIIKEQIDKKLDEITVDGKKESSETPEKYTVKIGDKTIAVASEQDKNKLESQLGKLKKEFEEIHMLFFEELKLTNQQREQQLKALVKEIEEDIYDIEWFLNSLLEINTELEQNKKLTQEFFDDLEIFLSVLLL